jgi:urease accessory protein
MGWPGSLRIDYRADALQGTPRTVAFDRHEGPLRILASLYPEAPLVCHNVLVHPPGGIVGGDTLAIELNLAAHTHALLSTPGATRFYRSAGEVATQTLTARVADGARLEWLPLETIAQSGCLAENTLRFELAAGAEMIGWDVLALGLPASNEAFVRGHYTQTIELPGHWLERAAIAATDTRLLDSPLGWAGRRVLCTMWFAAGGPIVPARREALLDGARALCGEHALNSTAGTSAAHTNVVVLRVLADRVEPAMSLLTQVWARWRELAWALPACPPRVWRT